MRTHLQGSDDCGGVCVDPECCIPKDPYLSDDGNYAHCGLCDYTCFPASATVQLSDGSVKSMADLRIGDTVLTKNRLYSDVLLFTHRDAKIQASFVSISTSSNHTIQLTPNHYIYVNGKLKQGRHVAPGDLLETAAGEQSTVVSTRSVTMLGLYNPQTLDGSIVVNGVRASTYTSDFPPLLAHALLWPVRVMYSLGIDTRWLSLDHGADSIAWLLGCIN